MSHLANHRQSDGPPAVQRPAGRDLRRGHDQQRRQVMSASAWSGHLRLQLAIIELHARLCYCASLHVTSQQTNKVSLLLIVYSAEHWQN